jgi:predicted cupin superfamily sugar epimerase/mannose-6-phosphate isomerase-like protein (cupin superfamily)
VPPGKAGFLIRHFQMQPIPQEGAWFSLTYTSDVQVEGAALPPRYDGRAHAAGSAILVVETPRDFSAMHRLRTDEVWHFYGGSPLDMLLLYPDGSGRIVTLGADVSAGQVPQLTVPHGVWQGSAPVQPAAAAPTGATSARTVYSFVGTQLSPAFDYGDFEMGYRDELVRLCPAYAARIARLTRSQFAMTPAAPSMVPAAVAAAPSPGAAPRSGAAAASVPTPTAAARAFPAAGVPTVTMSTGVTLQELVGRLAAASTAAVSVAKFVLAPGRSSGTSFNHRSQEVFLIIAGTGSVHLADQVTPVSADSTVFIPATVPHSIEADTRGPLTFYAISAPAFATDDYVPVTP